MSFIDPKHVTVRTAGNVYYSNRATTVSIAPPTLEQIACRERADWNATVDRRKAARQARRASAKGAAGQEAAPLEAQAGAEKGGAA